ncbi:MAG: HAD family phosphatase [Phycisphaerae bacterium]|nr:HAD family phosphatase [Phycisphaerae bacterium]
MKIRLIAVDLDGTLLNSQKEISPAAVEIIRKVRKEKSVGVVLTTARPPRSTLPFYKQLSLRGPMINYNGALVWMPTNGKVLLHQPIPYNIARGIIRWARERFANILVSAEIGDKWYTDAFDEADKAYLTETSKTHRPDVIGPFDEWLNQPVTKLLLLGRPQWLKAVNQAIREDLPDEVTTVQTEDFLLQIMQASVSKKTALATVAAELHIPREQIMAIGDNANDAGMIHWAGVGVAMANGHVTCLQAADHVTDHHDEEGVANVIRHIVLEGKPPHGV